MKRETIAIHVGYDGDPTTKAVAVPIYQTIAFEFDSAEHGAALFNLEVEGNIYTRIGNPTNAVLEKRVAALEGGVEALSVSAGAAAVNYSIQNITEVGTNIEAQSGNPAVIGGPRHGTQSPGHFLQQFIARSMPQRVVDVLEAIEVADHERKGALVPIGERHGLRQAVVPNHMLSRILSIAGVLAWSAIPAGAVVGGWVIEATHNVALVYGVIGAIVIGIAAFFRFFTALGDAQRYVDERKAEEERTGPEAVTA